MDPLHIIPPDNMPDATVGPIIRQGSLGLLQDRILSDDLGWMTLAI